MRITVMATVAVWVAIEASLMLRDLARGKGSTARDRGTRSLLVVSWLAAFVAAIWLAGQFGSASAWRLGRWHLPAGIVVMWIGIAIRVWAVVVLGSAFRTTVEVDAGQELVDRGPYRLVRHPSYTGILLIALGFGLMLGNWLCVVLLLAVPLGTMLRRIAVEEATLAEVIGQPYCAYQERTKRLVPGLW
ncbi:MAG TPA: isoprenylcysteine carboxylmethyltransferase family protein [Streptosporangiaceae bacterium]|nr:isoprenylcysteine carboxylmethyltransferase family protein [Streptosporangiaceae bacterium]